MSIYSNLDNEINRHMGSFNVILADKDIETFKRVRVLNSKFNFINLSSYFAVNFILEYEKIDLIIISRKISNLSNIVDKANRKKIKVYILGKDLELPINKEEVESVILKEIERKAVSKNKQFNFKECIRNFLSLNRKTNLQPDCNSQKEIENSSSEINKESDVENKKSDEMANQGNTFMKRNNNSGGKNKIENYKLSQINQKGTDIRFTGKNNYRTSNDIEIKDIRTIKQKIIILSKAKGGVGSTTISIFLGFLFNKIKTLLVDLNFSEGGGDISYYLDIPKSPNILNFINGYSRNSLENSVVKVRGNLDVLQAPPTYEMSKKIDLQDIYCLTDVAKKKYHLIIFDLPNRFDDLLLGIIDLADLLIMVSDYTLGSIGRLIEINNKFVYDDLEKILIINKYSKVNGLNLYKNQIEQFFNLKDFVFLDEIEVLRGKSEFSDFNFANLKNFDYLTKKIFDLLTYD